MQAQRWLSQRAPETAVATVRSRAGNHTLLSTGATCSGTGGIGTGGSGDANAEVASDGQWIDQSQLEVGKCTHQPAAARRTTARRIATRRLVSMERQCEGQRPRRCVELHLWPRLRGDEDVFGVCDGRWCLEDVW
mgnify:CR=1 FL=1